VAIADLPPVERRRRIEVDLVMSLSGGREVSVPVGGLEVQPSVKPPAESAGAAFPELPGPRVAICMATYNPPAGLLRSQLDSIRKQTHRSWVCLISDDCSAPEAFERLRAEVDGDTRFVLSRSEHRLGFYRNFERALSMAPCSADFVTLCDQDDSWHPDKLERLLGRIGDAQLAYSDARVVTPGGELIHSSYWTTRRNNHTNFASLMLANSVTGAASLFRSELLDDLLPFPPVLADPFHDHWLAIVAMALGEIAYVEEPLYDYVQHGGAVIGHTQANRKPRPARKHLLERLRNPGDGSRVAYYYNWHQQLLLAEVLKVRCWSRMEAPKRKTLARLLAADSRVTGLAWLLGRRARRYWGHNETLDRELFYAYALGRRRAVSLLNAGRSRPGRWFPRDARIPSPPGPRYPAEEL
jgi:glycosyltransferase involved in cell wall biosynthesis